MNWMKEQAVELYYPEKPAFTSWYQLLNRLNKSEVEDLAAPFLRIMRKKQVTAIDAQGNRRVPTQITEVLVKKYNIKKGELLDFLCFMLADVRNFQYYLNSLSETDKKVWKKALTQYYVSTDEIFRLTGEHWMPDTDSYFYSYYRPQGISDKLNFFNLLDAKAENKEGKRLWTRGIYCVIYEKLRIDLLPVFFPDACNLEGQILDKLPEDTPLHTFSGENDIFVILPILNGLYDSKQLVQPKSKLGLSALRKLTQAVTLTEFFPNHKEKEMALFRSSIVMNLYVWGKKAHASTKRSEDVLKEIFNTALHYPTHLLPILLPHLTGLRKKELLDSYGVQLAINLWNLMGTLPQQQWISVQGIHFKLLQEANRYVPLFPTYIFDKMDVFNDKLNHYVYLDSLYNEMSVPFINGLLYAMAAFGFVEVAYADESPSDASYTSSLAYIRLTNLGAYVWGQSKDYTPTALNREQGPLFELDEKYMLVRSLVTPNPYLPLLSEMAVPVGGQRYRVSSASFLSTCQTSKDIKEKIALFKQYICAEPSAEWEEFFNSLLHHSNSVSRMKDKDYAIYHISPEDKELQRIVSTDPFIRQYSLRAEGYLWLIEASKVKAVQKRLKECGYLF